jgi:hypothetical protein
VNGREVVGLEVKESFSGEVTQQNEERKGQSCGGHRRVSTITKPEYRWRKGRVPVWRRQGLKGVCRSPRQRML